MVGNNPNPTQLDDRDDFQHLRTQQLLALRVIAPPRSKLGALIEERLGKLYAEMGEELDPAKRKDPSRIQDRTSIEGGEQDTADWDNTPSMGGTTGSAGMLATPG